MILRGELVETGEQIVQHLHQFLGAALTSQSFMCEKYETMKVGKKSYA